MGILLFLIIVIVAIVFVRKSTDNTPKKGSLQEARIKSELYQEVDNITTKCFNEQTTEFNNRLYFENRDIYNYCGYPEIIEYMGDNLKYIGWRQCLAINAILEMYLPKEIIFELKKREENIIRNLIWVCGGGDESKCPDYIVTYRNKLYDLMREEIPCTKENTKKIVEDYNKGKKQTN